MRIILKKKLRKFWKVHSDCEQQLKSWYQEVSISNWENINELKIDYPKAIVLKNNRICFNIKGNKYRLIVKITFDYQMMWIRFV